MKSFFVSGVGVVQAVTNCKLIKIAGLACVTLCAAAASARADGPADYPVRPVPFTAVKVADGFWRDRLETNRIVTVWYAFKKCEETGRIDNFAKAARLMPGSFRGTPFDDSDVYKVIEGAAYCLATQPDPKLDAYLDALIAKIAAAQEPDGYLYTARTIHPDNPPGIASPKRWLNDCGGLKGNYGDSHELYNVGHLYEAAVAHFQATGKRTLLDVAVKSADLVASVWGPGKLDIPSGHPEIELALVKLYRVTGKRAYLDLSRFLVECRGRGKGLATQQYANHRPVTEQTEFVGHAVRSAYLASAVTDVAALLGDATYRSAVDALWADMAGRKMAVTGGLGARHGGEAMGDAYELPNAEAYNETCAAIANALWNHRLFLLTGDGKYLDVLERAVYNGALAGVSLSGDRFFYVNPLATDGHHAFNHGHSARFPWTGCACCPVNIARFIPSVPGFAYATRGRSVYAGLFLPGVAEIPLEGGKVTLRQTTDYPWSGRVRIEVVDGPGEWELKLRVPGWAAGRPVPTDLYRFADQAAGAATVKVNGQPVACAVEHGFVSVARAWSKGDAVELELPMPVRRVAAHAKVSADAGLLALERGPLVYCVEGADHVGGVRQLSLPADAALRPEHRVELLGGVTVLRGSAAESFHREDGSVESRPAELTAVPYAVWCHRGPNPMAVWLPAAAAQATPLPYPTLSSRSRPTASHTHRDDTVAALNDQALPSKSGDTSIPRFTWWDHKGTAEWVQYDFQKPERVTSAEVYWFDDEGVGACRVPQSWTLTYYDGTTWRQVANASGFGLAKDRFNRVTFDPVTTTALRLESRLQPDFSGGILEWRVSP
jgi:DUF1680 family protein